MLHAAGAGALLPLLSASQNASADIAAENLIVVGEGNLFIDINSALESIVDNSATNPYVIQIQPGIYSSFTMKPYVDVIGSGINSTIIETTSSTPIIVASDASLQNLKVHFSGTGGGSGFQGAIQKRSNITDLVLSDLEIHVDGITGAAGPRFGIYIVNGGHQMTFRNIKIKTESGGVHLSSGNYRFHGCDIYMTGNSIGLPHYGIYAQKAARIDWSGGRITTGYYYPDISNDLDQDVICIYIPASNTYGCRVEAHDAEMYARNANASSTARVNAVRAENGWVRLFGCLAQTELSNNINNNSSKTVFGAFGTDNEPTQGVGAGKIEVHGSRISSQEGNTLSGQLIGVATYNKNMNLEKWSGGLIRCDASYGAMTIKLPWVGLNKPSGELHHFVKIDDTNNPVTINLYGASYQGSFANPVLGEKYESLKIIWDGTEWIDA